jgi:hypothetical protein
MKSLNLKPDHGYYEASLAIVGITISRLEETETETVDIEYLLSLSSRPYIQRVGTDMILSYQTGIRRKDARVLAIVVANNAIEQCGLAASK